MLSLSLTEILVSHKNNNDPTEGVFTSHTVVGYFPEVSDFVWKIYVGVVDFVQNIWGSQLFCATSEIIFYYVRSSKEQYEHYFSTLNTI